MQGCVNRVYGSDHSMSGAQGRAETAGQPRHDVRTLEKKLVSSLRDKDDGSPGVWYTWLYKTGGRPKR